MKEEHLLKEKRKILKDLLYERPFLNIHSSYVL